MKKNQWDDVILKIFYDSNMKNITDNGRRKF